MARHVDSVEQHREVGRVDAHGAQSVGLRPNGESALLEALVVDDEASPVPDEDLAAVATFVEEDEDMPAERVENEHAAHDAEQAVVTEAHVDRLGGDPDSHAARQHQHARPASTTAAATAAT